MREPAKNPAAAQRRYVRFIQLPLSCLTKAIWVAGPSPEGDEDRSLTTSESPLRLSRVAGPPLLFSPSQRFQIVPDARYPGEWKASTLDYIYELSIDAAEVDPGYPTDLIGWHWHPKTTPDRPDPHVHVRASHSALGVTLGKLHLPTGRVAFEEIVTFLILELTVVPARNDWDW